jgi:hypothetical protein
MYAGAFRCAVRLPGAPPAPLKASNGAALALACGQVGLSSINSDLVERRRESILVLRTLASGAVGRDHPLWKALYRAYAAADDAEGARGLALLEAAHELDRLAAKPRRMLIDSYAHNMLISDEHRAPRRGRPAGMCDKAERKGAAA